MTALFISDLHLAAHQPENLRAFEDFLAGPAARAEDLYILGDLFDLWLGDDFKDPFNNRVLGALRRPAEGGTRVHLMVGNRDFLMGQRLARHIGANLLPDPSLIIVQGQSTLLMHGDRLCTDDVEYQVWRERLQHPLTRCLLSALPLFVRRHIAAHVRRKSNQAKERKSLAIMDANAGAIDQALRKAGYPILIHGHTHRPALHEHAVDGHTCERWVLPDWHGQAVWLEWDKDGRSFRTT